MRVSPDGAIDLNPYVEFSARTAHSIVRACFSEESLRHNLRVGLDDECSRRDLERAENYRTRCSVSDFQSDYRLRQLDMGADGLALAGIRLAGGDPAKPFVGVAGRTRLLEDTDALARLQSRLHSEFAPFAPRRCYLWATYADRALSTAAGVEVDVYWLAAAAGAIRQRPRETGAAPISLQPTSAAAIYERYRAIYQDWRTNEASLGAQVDSESLEELAEAERHGGLFRANVGGQLAGVLAARPHSHGLTHGWIIIDHVLDTPYRGRDLAVPFQRLLIDMIPAHDRELVFAQIVAANNPSLHTNRRVGLADIGKWVFAPLRTTTTST